MQHASILTLYSPLQNRRGWCQCPKQNGRESKSGYLYTVECYFLLKYFIKQHTKKYSQFEYLFLQGKIFTSNIRNLAKNEKYQNFGDNNKTSLTMLVFRILHGFYKQEKYYRM